MNALLRVTVVVVAAISAYLLTAHFAPVYGVPNAIAYMIAGALCVGALYLAAHPRG